MDRFTRYLEIARGIWRVVLVGVALALAYNGYQYYAERTAAKTVTKQLTTVVELAGDVSVGGSAKLSAQVKKAIAAGDYQRARVLLQPIAKRIGRVSDLEEELGAIVPQSAGAALPSGPPGPRAVTVSSSSAPSSGTSLKPLPPTPSAGGQPPPDSTRTIELVASSWACDSVAGKLVSQIARFPSISSLTDTRGRESAMRELQARLRCDYEREFGSRRDPNKPPFEEWRQAALQRQYGTDWSRIDFSSLVGRTSEFRE